MSNKDSHTTLLNVYGLPCDSLYCVLEDVEKNNLQLNTLAQSATAQVVLMLLVIVSVGYSKALLTLGEFAKWNIATGGSIEFACGLKSATSHL